MRLTPFERDERPIIGMDFAVREDGGVDDAMGTFLAIVDSSSECMGAVASEIKGATGIVKNLFVGKFRLRCDNEPSIMAVAEKVRANMPDTAVAESTQCTPCAFLE